MITRKQWIIVRWTVLLFFFSCLLLVLRWWWYIFNYEEVYNLKEIIQLFSGGKPLIYIPTREGLTSRYQQLERMHSNALRSNRSIVVLDNYSVHYKDLGRISLCNIFELPPTIQCSSAAVDKVVEVYRCTLPYVPKLYENPNQYKPSNFGLRDLQKVNKQESFSWDKTICTLAYGFYFNETTSNHIIPIRFKEQYVTLYAKAFRSIVQNTFTTIKPLFIVVHWRRGDQAGRCKKFEDVSINCGTVDDFITKVRNETSSYLQATTTNTLEMTPKRPIVTYIATNERDPAILRKLEANGYKLFKHLKWQRNILRVDTLTAFVVELQLMIHADVFLGWGTTGIGHFVRRARAEIGHPM